MTAWLVALLPDRAAEMVHRDAYGILTYGDPAQLRPDGRRALMAGLRHLVEAEPFFRAGHWGEGRFAALAVPELVPELRDVIRARPVRGHLLSCVLDALEEGEALPELGAELRALVLDAGVDHSMRGEAVTAFAKGASTADATELFHRLLHDDVADPRAQLAGRLLLRLYPAALDDDAAVTFFERFLSTDDGTSDSLHVGYRFPTLVPPGREAALLDRFATRGWSLRQSHPKTRHLDVQRIALDLAARALGDVERAVAPRVAAWLPLLADNDARGDKHALKASLASRPDLYVPLLLTVWHSHDGEPKGPWIAPTLLRLALPWFDPPVDAANRALDAVVAAPSSDGAVVLYYSALQLMYADADADAAFERAWSVGELHPVLLQARVDWSTCSLAGQEWRAGKRSRLAAEARRKADVRAADIAFLDEHIEAVRAGAHVNALGWLAARWFGEHDRTKQAPVDPEERLLAGLPRRIVDAAMSGFRAYALSAPVPEPAALARQAMENQSCRTDLIALAGTDLIFRDTGGLRGLSVERCTGLLCLALVCLTHTTDKTGMTTDRRQWPGHVARAFPDESERAMRELLAPQVRSGSEFVRGLAEATSHEDLGPIRNRLVPELLGVVPAPGSVFDTLCYLAGECDRTMVEGVVRARVHAAESHAARWPWLFLAWRLAPAEFDPELNDALRDDEGPFLSEIQTGFGHHEPFSKELAWAPLTLRHREAVVRRVGPRFPPVPMPETSWNPPTPFDYSRLVQLQIAAIGDTSGREAEQALCSLLAEPSLASYEDHILHALSGHRRDARLARREMPSLERLVRSLGGGPPATTAELQAFVLAHLTGLRDALRTTADNAWVAFWNVDAKVRGRVTTARPENDCRDAIVRSLAARFEKAGIAQEAEARFVGDTRCDIKVIGIEGIVPVEVKCDWHDRLWTAWEGQLRAQYSVDPKAGGFGVYLVVWFGEKRGGSRRVKPSPSGAMPRSARELQVALDDVMAEWADRLVAVVIDASPV